MIENIYRLKLGEVLTALQDALQIRLEFIGKDTVSLSIVTPDDVLMTHLTATKTKQVNINPTTRDLIFDYMVSDKISGWERSFLHDLAKKKDGYRLTEKQTEIFNRIAHSASQKHDKTRRRRSA